MLPEISYIFFDENITEEKIISVISRINGFICVLNTEAISTEVQIRSAYNHVYRDNEVSRRVRDKSLRLMIHITGERQIKNARRIAGFREGMNKAIIVYESAKIFEEFIESLGNVHISGERFIPEDNIALDRVILPRIAMSEFLT